MDSLIRLRWRQEDEREADGAENGADQKDRGITERLGERADAERREHRAELPRVGEERRRGPGAVGHQRLEEADAEIGDETDRDCSGNLRPEDSADAAREGERETAD